MSNDNLNYLKNNCKCKYRLNSYNNYREHKGYYILTYGKYKVVYASISFLSMISFIKDNNIPYTDIHINNLTLDDLANYCDIDERFGTL